MSDLYRPPDPALYPYDSFEQIIQNVKTNNEKVPFEEKKLMCPFRKIIVFMDCDEKDSWAVPLDEAYYMEEDFLECLKDKCAMWDGCNNRCGGFRGIK